MTTFDLRGGRCVGKRKRGRNRKSSVQILYGTRDKPLEVLENVQSSSKTKPTQVLRRIGSTPEFTQNQRDLFMVEAPCPTAPRDPALAILVCFPNQTFISFPNSRCFYSHPLCAPPLVPPPPYPLLSPASFPAGWARHSSSRTLTRGHSGSGPADVAPPGTLSSRRR